MAAAMELRQTNSRVTHTDVKVERGVLDHTADPPLRDGRGQVPDAMTGDSTPLGSGDAEVDAEATKGECCC